MPIAAPHQVTTVTPFAARDWATISKDFAVLFPDPEIRTGETIYQALARPLRGENVILNDPLGVGGCWWRNRVLRDEDQLDTGFQVTRKDATHINVTAGAAVCCGIYLQIIDATTTISLGDSSAFLTVDSTAAFPARANTPYYLTIVPDDTTTIGAGSGFGFALIMCRAWEHVMVDRDKEDFAAILAVITLNGSGQIQDSSSITFSRSVTGFNWNREDWAYPPGPPLSPLNGGVVRDGSWYEDWS